MLLSTNGAPSLCWINGGLPVLLLKDRMAAESKGGTRRGGNGEERMGRGWKGRRRK